MKNNWSRLIKVLPYIKNSITFAYTIRENNMKSISFLLDNEIEATLDQLIKDNESDPLTEQEIEDLKLMSIGEVCWLGFTHVKRVS